MLINVKEINEMSKDVRFEYLKKAEKVLKKLKKSADISGREIIAPVSFITEKVMPIKSKQFVAPEEDSIHVKVVANTAYWLDSQMDVILPGAWNKSINERKGLIPFLHDHLRSLDARVADVTDIYEAEMSLNQLGIDKDGRAYVLIFEGDVKKGYNENIFEQYKNGQVNQHSIGLRYMDLALAINDPDDESYFKEWEQNIGNIINPELAIEMGYFWVVKELKLIENSAVLFGANEITPTLETRSQEEETQSQEVGINPPEHIEPRKALNFNEYLKDFKL